MRHGLATCLVAESLQHILVVNVYRMSRCRHLNNNHPETFRIICSRDYKDLDRMIFRLRPILLDFENVQPPKITDKPGPRFQNSLKQ